jgi:adenylosuccinate synthase
MVPAGAVVSPNSPLAIAPGAEVDPEVLNKEISDLTAAGHSIEHRLIVDPQATVLTPNHRKQETTDRLEVGPTASGKVVNLVDRIGSTGKGIGAARADRIMRTADLYGGDNFLHDWIDHWITQTRDIIIEATQGFGLGLHAGYYPYCTSRDVRAIDVLAECGISPWHPALDVEVWVVFRPFPIRVAGNSGPLLGETSWDDLGLPPEYTTVTNRMRRVGHWDAELARNAMAENGAHYSAPVNAILMFADHVIPGLYGLGEEWEDTRLTEIEEMEADIEAAFAGLGTSPQTFIWRTYPY